MIITSLYTIDIYKIKYILHYQVRYLYILYLNNIIYNI